MYANVLAKWIGAWFMIKSAILSILFAIFLSVNVAAESPKNTQLKTWKGKLETKQFDAFLKGKYQVVKGDVLVINSNLKNLQALRYLTEVDGNVLIGNQDEKYAIGGNPDLVSLQGLESLRSVSGVLRVSSNPNLQSLSALKKLESLGYLLIQKNNQLENLAGLENLKKATNKYGGLSIWDNRHLKQIKALDSLVELSSLSISGNPSLDSLEGLHKLTEIKGSVYIDKNSKLDDLSGLRNLKLVGDYFQVRANNGLKDFSGLENLERIEGFFSVSENKQLISFKGLNKLVYVDDLWIKENPRLENLTGLNQLEQIKSSLEIIDNASLNSLNALNKLKTVGYHFRIYNNPKLAAIDGFKNLEEVNDLLISSTLTANSFPRLSRVKKLSIHVNTTLQAEDFSVAGWLPNIKSVEVLNIGGNKQLTSLKGLLQNLKEAKEIYIGSNKSLDDFDGLNGLEKAKEITIKHHHSGLYSISGFNSLKSLERLDIVNNKYLNNISGFNRLTTAKTIYLSENRDLEKISGFNQLDDVDTLWVKENPSLLQVSGFSRLKGVQKTLWIDENPLLSKLDGFRGLQEVNELFIDQNPRLKSLKNFKNLKRNNSLRISENDGLKNLDGFEGLKGMADLRVEDNPNLESLDGLQTLKAIGDVRIKGNPKLVSLDGLNNLMGAINVEIKDNDALKNLSGLKSFLQIVKNGKFVIHQNDELTSLSGIESMTYVVGKLKVYKNPKLNNFDALPLSVLNYLENKNVSIYENADNPSLNDLRLSASLSRVEIPKEQLEKQTLKKLKLLRNEVFARKGYAKFSDALFTHFSQKGWYKPQSSPLEIKLSKIEEANIKNIKAIESYRSNQVANMVKQLKSSYKQASFLSQQDKYFKPSMVSFIKYLDVQKILNFSSQNIRYEEAYYIADDHCADSISLFITANFDEFILFVTNHSPYEEQAEHSQASQTKSYCNLRVKSTKEYDEGGALQANGCWIEPYQCLEDQETDVAQISFRFKVTKNKLEFKQRIEEEYYD